jgi:hypothetical protein
MSAPQTCTQSSSAERSNELLWHWQPGGSALVERVLAATEGVGDNARAGQSKRSDKVDK